MRSYRNNDVPSIKDVSNPAHTGVEGQNDAIYSILYRTSNDQLIGDSRPDSSFLQSGELNTKDVVREFQEKKGIRRLTPQEIEAKNDHFKLLYAPKPNRPLDGTYQIEVTRKSVGSEPCYTNSVDFSSSEIMGDFNNSYHDDKIGRMHLTDIKYQTLRIAIEEYNKDNPGQPIDIETFRPKILSGGDIEERSVMKLADKFPIGSKLSFAKNTPEFDAIMSTKIAKEKIFYAGNYTAGQISHVVVERGNRSKYIGSMKFYLAYPAGEI